MIFISIFLNNEEKKKVSDFLNHIKPILAANDCEIVINVKNQEFDRLYSLKHQEKVEILKSLTVDDCISIEPNNNPRFKDAEVFKFIKNVELLVFGEKEDMDLYIKMYTIECSYYDKVIVISFHKEGIHE